MEMRYGERCPSCGHPEWVNWRRRWLDEEVDFVETDNVPELAEKLRGMPLKILADGQWTYRLTTNQRFVERILTAEYRARGGGKKVFHPKAKLGGSTKNSLARKRIIHRVLTGQRKQLRLDQVKV